MKHLLLVFSIFCGILLCGAASKAEIKSLGVKSVSGNFSKFEVKPFPGNLKSASGAVDTPSGKIYVTWSKSASGLDVVIRHPENLECITAQYKEFPVANFTVQSYKVLQKPAKPHDIRWISHRGESYIAPENTIPAFELANKTSDGMETDLMLTADGMIVCNHDGSTKRVSGVDKIIGKSTFAELQKVDVSNKKKGFSNVRTPLFSETLKYLGKDQTYFIEVKGAGNAGRVDIVKKAAAEIKAAGISDKQIIFFDADDSVLRDIKNVLPEYSTMLTLARYPSPDPEKLIFRLMQCGADGINIAGLTDLDEDYVKTLHDAGYLVAVWTVNDGKWATRFYAAGVDYMLSDLAGIFKKGFDDCVKKYKEQVPCLGQFVLQEDYKNPEFGENVKISMVVRAAGDYELVGWNANIIRKDSPEFLENTLLDIVKHPTSKDHDSVTVAPYTHLPKAIKSGKAEYIVDTGKLLPGKVKINFIGRFLDSKGNVLYKGSVLNLDIKQPGKNSAAVSGISKYVIYIAQDSPASTGKAAGELQNFIRKSCGVFLPVVRKFSAPAIVVGKTPETVKNVIDPEKLDYNEYIIRNIDGNIYIVGRDIANDGKTPMGGKSYGTLRGAYTFIEEVLGVHILQSGKFGEDITKHPANWEIPAVNIRRKPFFRSVCLFPTPKCGDDFLHRNGYFGPGGNDLPYSSTHSWNMLYPSKDNNNRYKFLKTREETYAEHPEFFEMSNNGKRVMPPPGEVFSICLSAPGIYDDIANRIMLIHKHTGAMIFPISPNDGAPSCRCAGCRAGIEPMTEKETGPLALDINGSSTPIVLEYYRQICLRVAKINPDILLTGYIYNTSEFAPTKKTEKMPPNFIGDMAPLHTDYGPVRLSDDVRKSWHKWKDNWVGLLGNKFYYGLGFWLRQSSGAPISPMPEIMKETFDYLRTGGFTGVLFYPNEGLGHSGIYLWTLLKMIDDPSRSPSALMDDYLKYSYGEKAGKKVRKIYELSESSMKKYYTKLNGRGGYNMSVVMLKDVYAPIFSEMEKLFLEAEKLADTPERKWRLSLLGENLKLLRFQLESLGMIPVDENSPLHMNDRDYMKLALRTKGDLRSYVDPPTESISFKSSFKKVEKVVPDKIPDHMISKVKGHENGYKYHADFMIYAPEDMTVDMQLKYDVPDSPYYGKDIAYYTVYDSDGNAFHYSIGRKGHLTFPAKKGEHYYLVYSPQGQGWFDPGWRVMNCNAPFAGGHGTHLVNGGKLFRGKGSFYFKLTEKTDKLQFFIHGYPFTVKFIDPSGRMVKSVSGNGFENPVIENPAMGWWRMDFDVPQYIAYIRSPQLNGFWFTDPSKAMDIRLK